MPACPVCHAEIDDAARAAGKCPGCGAKLLHLPQRTIAEIRLPKKESDVPDDDENISHATTIDIPLVTTAKSLEDQTLDDQTHATIEFPSQEGDEQGIQPSTITFGEEKTVEWSGTGTDPDATLLASQWQQELKHNDPGATIKQRETITGSYITSSSLIVKSRHVRQPGQVGVPVTSASDAPDYELLNVIGEGGMGVVYAARQSSIARTVALKMLKDEEGKNAAHRDKFISEAVVTGELDHPNIVPIYDLGANDEGALFYSMKRVKGTPWNKVVKTKTLDENLNILLRVADAVAFAHVNGVIHRDLKPENVMLGDFGEVLVMDWGLARVSAKFPQAAAVTQSDAMGGTPAYMAPEMATGPLEKITEASDVYLLGAILYEIVIGRPPHSGKTVMSCLFSAAKNEIAVPDKSHELIDVALRAMANAPEDRYADVPTFQGAVREYQAHSESIKLVGHASTNMTKAAETQDYELYARALYGLEESLTLWPANRRAATLLSTARLDYARLALGKGDYDLGASLLDPAVPDHQEVLGQLQGGLRERESRQRRIKMLKGAVAALLVSVIGIGVVAYVRVKQEKDIAVEAQVKEKAQREIAEQKTIEATEQRAIAVKNEETANEQRGIAVKNEQTANEQRAIAVKNEQTANEQREIAVAAREQEEYQAYVARIGLTNAKIGENAFDRAEELLAVCPVDLRRWEWGRLEFLCHLADQTWQAPARIDSAVMSPDGEHFATGGSDGKAAICNLRTGQREHEMEHGPYVHSVAYDSAGARLASGSINGTVHIYQADGKQLAEFPAHKDGVMSVRFSPDDKWLLTSGYDNLAKLWDLAGNFHEPIQVFEGHSWWVCDAEFSPDGQRIVTAGQDGKAIVWQRGGTKENPAANFHELTSFAKHKGPIYAARFSPDGQQVATAGYDGRVLLWKPEEVQPINIELRVNEQPDPEVKFRELLGHRGPVRTLAFAPDGKTLASGGQDNMVLIWDLAAGAPLKTLRGHASHVRAVAYSADGGWLLTAGRDQQIKLWQPAKYAEERELAANPQDRDSILAARFSPDGKQIVTAGRDRTATLWNAQSLAAIRKFEEGHDFLATAAVFFDDGSRLATAAGDGTVRLWDVATGAEMFRLEGTGRTAALAVADDGQTIVTGSIGNRAQIWDASSGKKLQDLGEDEEGEPIEITAARFAPGGQILATGDDVGRCRLWRYNATTGRWTSGAKLNGHSRTITAMAFADGGARLITASGDNTCGQWNVATATELADRVLKHPDWVGDLVVSRDGRTALTGCDDGKLRVWSLDDARIVRTIEPVDPTFAVSSIDMTPDARLAAVTSAAEGTVRLWDLNTGQERTAPKAGGAPGAWIDYGLRSSQIWAARFTPEGQRLLAIGGNDARLFDLADHKMTVRFSPSGVLASADMSPDGTRVVTGSWDRAAKVWDAATGHVVVKLDGLHQGEINATRYSPDGKRILTASDDGTVRLWDAATGKPLEVILHVHNSRVRDACFSPDGARILTVSNDKLGRVWDAATGEEKFALQGHSFAVRCGAFNSDDGKFIITGSDDNTAIIWDAATGKQLVDPATGEPIKLAGHTAAISSVALSPDGGRALTGGEDNAVKLWDAKTGKEILTLSGHSQAITSVSFSPDGLSALTSSHDGRTLVWPALDWTGRGEVRQAQRSPAR